MKSSQNIPATMAIGLRAMARELRGIHEAVNSTMIGAAPRWEFARTDAMTRLGANAGQLDEIADTLEALAAAETIPNATLAATLQGALNTLRERDPACDTGVEIRDSMVSVITALTGATVGAGEGPSDGEMFEWVVENLIEKRAVIGGGVAVHWVDADGEDRWTRGKDTRGAMAAAMQESDDDGSDDPGIAIMRAEREQWECDRCDGCGWYEGGKTLKTHCEECGGTGVVSRRQREDAAGEPAGTEAAT